MGEDIESDPRGLPPVDRDDAAYGDGVADGYDGAEFHGPRIA